MVFKMLFDYLSYFKAQRKRNRGLYSSETQYEFSQLFKKTRNVNIKFSYLRFLRHLGNKLDKEGFFLS